MVHDSIERGADEHPQRDGHDGDEGGGEVGETVVRRERLGEPEDRVAGREGHVRQDAHGSSFHKPSDSLGRERTGARVQATAGNLGLVGGIELEPRPGKPTADFITKVLNKITMFGALYLSVIAIAPIITGNLFGYSSLAIGGTSVIIVVGVALETVQALESQMLMRQYKGFLE